MTPPTPDPPAYANPYPPDHPLHAWASDPERFESDRPNLSEMIGTGRPRIFELRPWHRQVLDADGPPRLRLAPDRGRRGEWVWKSWDVPVEAPRSPLWGIANDPGGELTRGQFLLDSARMLALGREDRDVGKAFADLIDRQDRAARRIRYATITRRTATGTAVPFVVPVPADVGDADQWFRDDTAAANGMGC